VIDSRPLTWERFPWWSAVCFWALILSRRPCIGSGWGSTKGNRILTPGGQSSGLQCTVVHYSANGHGTPIEDVPFNCAQDKGVNHGRPHILVAQQFLDGTDVVTILKLPTSWIDIS